MQDNVFIPTEKNFKRILSETVEKILEQRIPEIIRRANRKEILTTADFEELTGCGYRVQAYLRKENKIPYSQEGRKIFYLTSDVEKFIDERRVKATGKSNKVRG